MCTDTNNKELIQADKSVKDVSNKLNKLYVQGTNTNHTEDILLLENCVEQLNSVIFLIKMHRHKTNL